MGEERGEAFLEVRERDLAHQRCIEQAEPGADEHRDKTLSQEKKRELLKSLLAE